MYYHYRKWKEVVLFSEVTMGCQRFRGNNGMSEVVLFSEGPLSDSRVTTYVRMDSHLSIA